jgi:pimeloyl-ACP methyl ester carboxylesterase
MARFRMFGVVLFALTVATCDRRQPLEPEARHDGPTPNFSISDGAHGGNPHFFFLPTTVPNWTAPGGQLDVSVSPVVEICEWSGTACVLPLTARFTMTSDNPSWKVGLSPGGYFAAWETGLSAVDGSKTYRVRVLLSELELGYIDVDVVLSDAEARAVDKTKFAAVIRGTAFQIKFHINKGFYFRLTPSASTFGALGGTLSVSVPVNAVSGEQHIMIERVSVESPMLVGSAFEIRPTSLAFAAPIRMFAKYDLSTGPSFEEATLTVRNFTGSAWTPVTGNSIDPIAKGIYGVISRGGTYGVVAEAVAKRVDSLGGEIIAADQRLTAKVDAGALQGGPLRIELQSTPAIGTQYESLSSASHILILDRPTTTLTASHSGILELRFTTSKPVPGGAIPYVRARFAEIPGVDYWGEAQSGTLANEIVFRIPADELMQLFQVFDGSRVSVTLSSEAFTPENPPPPPQSSKPDITSNSEVKPPVDCYEYPLSQTPGSRAMESGSTIVVLVHGWSPSINDCEDFIEAHSGPSATLPGSTYFLNLVNALEGSVGSTVSIFTFTYTSWDAVEDNGRMLGARLRTLNRSTPIGGVLFIGHSMGGLVARAAASDLDRSSTTSGLTRGIITIGTPHLGSPLAGIANLFPGLTRTAGTQSLIAGLPTPETKPLIVYGAHIGSRPAAELSDYNPSTLTSNYHIGSRVLCRNYRLCANDGVVPFASAIPTWAHAANRAFNYDHSELHKGFQGQGLPNDVLYVRLAEDVRAFLPSATGTTFYLGVNRAKVCNGTTEATGPLPQPCPVNPATVITTITATLPSTPGTNPFTRVELYHALPGDISGTLIGIASGASVSDSGGGIRTITWSIPWTAANLSPGLYRLYAVGIASTGEGVKSNELTVTVAID